MSLKRTKQNINMHKMVKSLAAFICIAALLISGISCAPEVETPAAATQVDTVQPGNLTISVSVDGNLVMPQAYNLLFGAPGDVRDVFVEEGDLVKEGAVLATLDNTTQKLNVESSNNNLQQVLARLYENVPLLPQFPAYSYSGPPYTEDSPGWPIPQWPPDPNGQVTQPQ